MLLNADSDHVAIRELLEPPLIDLSDIDRDSEEVRSNKNDGKLDESAAQHELSHINPLADDPCCGVDLYAEALQTLLN